MLATPAKIAWHWVEILTDVPSRQLNVRWSCSWMVAIVAAFTANPAPAALLPHVDCAVTVRIPQAKPRQLIGSLFTQFLKAAVPAKALRGVKLVDYAARDTGTATTER
jgi:hypothetical protein